jgi:hypothetical protein
VVFLIPQKSLTDRSSFFFSEKLSPETAFASVSARSIHLAKKTLQKVLDKFTWHRYTGLAKKTWQARFIMNKDDILKMSRKENKNGDEREEKIKLRSYAISAAIGALICMVLVFLEGYIFDRSTTVIWIIYCGIMLSKSILDAIQLKKRPEIAFSILWGFCFISNTVFYILDNIG